MDFEITFWDWITFLSLALVGFIFLTIALFIASIPGRIAIARNHPDAEAVKLMGLLGVIAIVPWLKAFMWAFNPSNIVDIRRFPKDEQLAIKEKQAGLKEGDDEVLSEIISPISESKKEPR